ncbi:MAG: class I SAM-dependent methyltransferase [Flavobacteriales bacterium]|nr:class I SAM-dependent methyltransferase [Flavobacteriales bacterium]
MGFLRLKGIDEYDLDDPRRTIKHKEIILSKPFLKKLYQEWYSNMKKHLNGVPEGKILELGSGGGFLKDIIPDVITSDILPLPGNDMVFDALDMPFEDNSVSAFLMVDVFHHVPDSLKFLQEMRRTLKPGGKIVMNEPWNSAWGRFIYNNFHHETFNPKGDWKIPSSGPMSDANGALPYIVFDRDRERFSKEFPELKITCFKKHTPLRYLLSGGVSMKSLVPSFSFGFLKGIESVLQPISGIFSMFVTIVIEKDAS